MVIQNNNQIRKNSKSEKYPHSIEEINSLIDKFEFDTAKIFLEKNLIINPNDTDLLDTLSEVLLGLDEVEEAIQNIKKSIKLSPNNNPEKYMTIGQLDDNPKNALKYYKKGIELFINELSPENKEVKNSLASACAAIAEIYMTTDLCNEKNAEQECETYLKQGLIYNEENFDVLMQLANLRILRRRDDEALKYMEKIYEKIIINDDNTQNLNINMEQNINMDLKCNIPQHEFLINLSKNFSELGNFNKAIKLLDVAIKINDNDIESWYLLAFNHFSIFNMKYAFKCLKHFKVLSDKIPLKNENITELEKAAEDLFKAIQNETKKTGGILKNNNIEEESEEEKITNNSVDNIQNIDIKDINDMDID